MEEDPVDVNRQKYSRQAFRQESVDSDGIRLCLAFCKSFSTSVLPKGRGIYSAGGNGRSAPGMVQVLLGVKHRERNERKLKVRFVTVGEINVSENSNVIQ